MMVLFSRSFLRRRLISLATTASVSATSFALAQDPTGPHGADHLRSEMPIQSVTDRSNGSEEQPFLSENEAAMKNMMAYMTIKPTGDADREFVAMMVPHHPGAVDMANAELNYGHNAQLRRQAREIVANQQQEITVLRNAVSDWPRSASHSLQQTRAKFSPQSAPNGLRCKERSWALFALR
jgi:hypothetical protein